jgi:aspartyl-tRNA synthetase
VCAHSAPNTAEKSRKFFDEMNDWARAEGLCGPWLCHPQGRVRWPIAKNHGTEGMEKLYAELGLGADDGLFFAAGKADQAAKLAGVARPRGPVARTDRREPLRPVLDRRLPLLRGRRGAGQHRFRPQPLLHAAGRIEALTDGRDPLSIKAFQYDLVCNGYEIASGSIRNQHPDLMVKAFEMVGLSKQDVEDRFGGMYRAFQYGAPPHGGMAAGVDRIVMLICGAQNLREITLFPMNQRAEDLLMNAPAPASLKQLRELHIRVIEPSKS